jgi:threonine/homoserine/homoserine lactone efflux protein
VTFLLLGASLGLAAGLSPGPVVTMVVLETFRGGWPRGAAVAAGPLLADGPIVLIAVFLLAQLPAGLIPTISILGGAFLVYLGATTMLASRRKQGAVGEQPAPRTGLLTGVVARVLSPNPYLFWFLVGGPLIVQAGRQGWWVGAAFLVGYYSTIVGSNVVLALALHRWVGRLSERVVRRLLLISGAILAAYGLALVSSTSPSGRGFIQR